MVKETVGEAVNGNDDEWEANCPNCQTNHEFSGFYDPEDITECACGCKFRIVKLWLDDRTFIE